MDVGDKWDGSWAIGVVVPVVRGKGESTQRIRNAACTIIVMQENPAKFCGLWRLFGIRFRDSDITRAYYAGDGEISNDPHCTIRDPTLHLENRCGSEERVGMAVNEIKNGVSVCSCREREM